MLSQQNLIYLGLALLVVGIAFFAYQELQKHHTEIEKLRMQSQKLQKIIHAYNMGQWHASEYRNNDEKEEFSESESSDEEDEKDVSSSDYESDTQHKMVNSILQNTLNSMGNGSVGTPSRVTVSAGGKTVQFPVVTPLGAKTPYNYEIKESESELESDIPNVDTFDGVFNAQQTKTDHPLKGIISSSDEEISEPHHLEEMEQDDEDIYDNKKESEEKPEIVDNTFGGLNSYAKSVGNVKEKELCQVPLSSGDRKGEACGNAAKMKGMCLRHFRLENK